MNKNKYTYVALVALLLIFTGCRDDRLLVISEKEDLGRSTQGQGYKGMYVLCEGAMGSNNCSLDYLDMSDEQSTAHYLRNIYSERNPSVVMELGDVGNDIKIYGNRMWMVINCSNKVEVVDAASCKRIGQVNIGNCRYVAFSGGYAYVSSYVGPVSLTDGSQVGRVYKVDTLTLQKMDSVEVGYQPDELEVVGNKLYVANSGGYLVGIYDKTVSVIDLTTFREERKITVGINPHRVRSDRYGQLWVTSRGDYNDTRACLYLLTPDSHGKMQVTGCLPQAVSDMCIVGDSLYYISTEWSNATYSNIITYGIINVRTHEIVTNRLSDAPELASVRMPYGIIVNPEGRDFYVMDAKNYTSRGELLHFNSDGTFDWRVNTGYIPAHACFLK